jgi:hypothetical protein
MSCQLGPMFPPSWSEFPGSCGFFQLGPDGAYHGPHVLLAAPDHCLHLYFCLVWLPFLEWPLSWLDGYLSRRELYLKGSQTSYY